MKILVLILLFQLIFYGCKGQSSQMDIKVPSADDFYNTIHDPLNSPSSCNDGLFSGSSRTRINDSSPDELLPAGLNPVQAHDKLCSSSGLQVSKKMRHVFSNFDASKSSVRHYDHVAPLDGMTIGMGHWPQNEVGKFFQDMDKHALAKNQFMKRAIESFMGDESSISLRQCELSLGGSACTKENITKLLSSTIFNKEYMKKHYSKNCRGNDRRGFCTQSKPNMYKQLPWLAPVLKRGLRDKAVTRWQLDFYKRDVIASGESQALKSGLGKTKEAILLLSSLDSSGSSWARYIGKSRSRGYVDINGKKYDWFKPEGINNPTTDEIHSWRLLLAYRYYNFKKGQRRHGCKRRIRTRQAHLYCNYMKDSWNKLWPDAPLGKDSCEPIRSRITESQCSKLKPVTKSPCQKP
ncbi:MAG: hypothetical protein KC493_14320 [Bacteriovoracaceae bacterium]|nr:hypothetical protein [Bacteriovoracaceae bacterium]